MEVKRAASAGFCFGVKRAAQMAFAAARDYASLCSLGPLIHSPQLVGELEQQGVAVVDQVEDIQREAVIIRSHGVAKETLAQLQQRSLHVVDATCPFVKKAQEHAQRLGQEGYTVVIVGEREHPEVQGIRSYVSGQAYIFASAAEAEALPQLRKCGVVAQTTQSQHNLQEIARICLQRCAELRVYNTICDATSVRQEEARTLAQKVDVMLVIGGYNSANTNRLAQICREIQPRTYHIEEAWELQHPWFDQARTVGVTAGASTPEWIIDAVVAAVEQLEPATGCGA